MSIGLLYRFHIAQLSFHAYHFIYELSKVQNDNKINIHKKNMGCCLHTPNTLGEQIMDHMMQYSLNPLGSIREHAHCVNTAELW